MMMRFLVPLSLVSLASAQPGPFGESGGFPSFNPFHKDKGICRDNLIGKEFACNSDSLDIGMGEEKNQDVFLKFMSQGNAQNSVDERFADIFPFQNIAPQEIFVLIVEKDDEDHEEFDFFEANDWYDKSDGTNQNFRSPTSLELRTRDIVSAGVCACIINEPTKKGLPPAPFVNQNNNNDDEYIESPSKFVCFLEEDNINNSTLFQLRATEPASIYDLFGAWDFTSTLSGSVQGDNLRAFSISAILKDAGVQTLNLNPSPFFQMVLPHYVYLPFTRSLLDCVSQDVSGYESDFLLPPFGMPVY